MAAQVSVYSFAFNIKFINTTKDKQKSAMSTLDSAKNAFHGLYKSVAEYVTPNSTLKTSKFHEKGTLTPAEYITAGNQLTYRCPNWTWEGQDAIKRWPFLPEVSLFTFCFYLCVFGFVLINTQKTHKITQK